MISVYRFLCDKNQDIYDKEIFDNGWKPVRPRKTKFTHKAKIGKAKNKEPRNKNQIRFKLEDKNLDLKR